MSNPDAPDDERKMHKSPIKGEKQQHPDHTQFMIPDSPTTLTGYCQCLKGALIGPSRRVLTASRRLHRRIRYAVVGGSSV